jgi:MerR family Zn(II)-responsive transcriptional regulator of zntA
MLTIGRLARAAGVTTDTLRYYERERLIVAAAATDSGYRLYGPDALARLAFIKHARACGFSIAEVRTLLAAPKPGELERLRAAAERKKREVDEKAVALQAMSAALGAFIAGLQNAAGVTGDLPRLLANAAAPNGTRVPRVVHFHGKNAVAVR